MVFNPTLQSGVAFEQPLPQAPSGVQVFGGILEGLGVFAERRSPREPTTDERFNAAVQQFADSQGISSDLASWTPGQFRGFGSAFPSFATKAAETAETLGGAGLTQQRSERDSFIDYLQTPEGILASTNAQALHPDDNNAQAIFIAQSRVEQAQRATQFEDLQRRSQEAGFRGNISQEAWDLSKGVLRDQSFAYAVQLANIGEAIAAGGTVKVSEVAPDLLPLMGGVDISITPSNIARVAEMFKGAMLRQYRTELSGAFSGQRIMDPSSEYITEVFSQFDSVVGAIASETDPSGILTRFKDESELRFRRQVEAAGQGGFLTMLDVVPSDLIMNMIQAGQGQMFVDGARIIGELATGSQRGEVVNVNPQNVQNMSAPDATNTERLLITAIDAVSTGTATPQQEALAANAARTLPLLAARTGNRYAVDVYETLFNRRAIEAINNGGLGEDAQTSLSQLVTHDLQLEINDIREAARAVDGTLVFENGQIRFQPSSFTSNPAFRGMGGGGSLEADRQLPGSATTILNRINEKLRIVGNSQAADILGEGFTDAIGVDVPFESFSDTSAASRYATDAERPANFLAENVFATEGMQPLVGTSEGASRLIQPGAVERMDAVLQGPFQDLQRIFGQTVTINDALAKSGTLRESERPNSRHFHGDAIDIDISRFSPEERIRLVQAALQAGFQGFGLGNTILHLDMGHPRSWDYENTTFGNMPVSEVQAMIRSGLVDPTALPTAGRRSGSTQPRAVNETLLGLIRSSRNTEPVMEYDPGEGNPTNFQTYGYNANNVTVDPAIGDPAPVAQLVPNNAQIDNRRPSQETPREIQSLIEGLAGRPEAIQELLRFLNEMQDPAIEGPQ